MRYFCLIELTEYFYSCCYTTNAEPAYMYS